MSQTASCKCTGNSTTVEQFQPHKDDKSNRLTDD